MGTSARLSVDFGTSNTVAVLRREDGSEHPLLLDASPLLASAVLAAPNGTLLTGADAERAAPSHPAGYEPNPKRHVDDGTLWLGERELPVDEIIGAVLLRVVTEARRVAGGSAADGTVLTHPAAWGRGRLEVLVRAARRAGLTDPRLVPEPVAAAAYFATGARPALPTGHCVVVYDLGAGTFDVSVVRRTPGGFEVLASDGLPDVGGLDLDATVVGHARSLTGDSGAWERLDWPRDVVDQRARHDLWRGARSAKEQLSRHASAPLHVPLAERELHLTRDEFETAARPYLDRTVALTLATLRAAGVPRERIAGLFLVGGASRIPLVATLLQRGLGIPPTVTDQPELVVARGGLRAEAVAAASPAPAVPPPSAVPTPSAGAAPGADPAPSAGPASGPPASGPAVAPPGPGWASPVPASVPAPRGVPWRRPWLWLGAAALVLLLVVVSAVVAWRVGVLPGAVPDSAAGVNFNATGKRNAKLFDSRSLLELAAPWLNDGTCAKKQPDHAVEEVDCDAERDLWHIRFEERQSTGDRNFFRPQADGSSRDGYQGGTYTASHPASGFYARWCDRDGDECHTYWDDDASPATADLYTFNARGTGGDASLVAYINWVGRVHPAVRER
ncbi:Hsp70 family protein [Micromonospora sp. NPDC049559]|uniref:Hsp70 family protein n=1 Tax=Micromonospora sp. NPDC049559 TaxID=3155923 RepID=UPI0034201C53